MTEEFRGTIEGFDTLGLRSEGVELQIVPALGARMISLRSRRTGREWLWRTEDGRGLFAAGPGTPFEHSPLAGIDECLPSIAACDLDGVTIPDHGEAWSAAWRAHIDAISIVSELSLRCLPLRLIRRIQLAGDTIEVYYCLTNCSVKPVRYLWALHPLFQWQDGWHVELGGKSTVRVSAASGAQLKAGAEGVWPEPQAGINLALGNLGAKARGYCKAFMSTRTAPRIALIAGGERLELSVNPDEVSHWGYWLTRGGWHGHTHLALEPTNAAADSVAEVHSPCSATTLQPLEVRRWTLRICLRDAAGIAPPLTSGTDGDS